MKRLALAFVCCFFVLLSLPELDTLEPVIQPSKLHGAVAAVKRVKLSVSSYLSGKFESAYEQRFDAKLALRGPLVRLQNETNLRIFSELDQNANLPLVLGKKQNLFEKEYIDALNRRDHVPVSELVTKVRRLRLLQDYLEKNGSTLLVVVSPSKANLYPELLPDSYRDERFPDLPTNYQAFVPLLREQGIHFIDAERYLEKQKAKVSYPLFTNTGAHWDPAASCPIAARIMSKLGDQLGRDFASLRCGRVRMKNVPGGTEHDLSNVANLWFESALFEPAPYPEVRPKPSATGDQPSLLVVGGSFVWALLSDFEKYGFTRNVDYLYYYSTWVHSPGRKKVPFDHAELDFPNDVFKHDAIVIEINASVVQKVGFGLLEDAERAILSGASASPPTGS